MMDYVVLILTVGACLSFTAWREHRNRNARDGRLMALLGIILMAGGAALSLAAP